MQNTIKDIHTRKNDDNSIELIFEFENKEFFVAGKIPLNIDASNLACALHSLAREVMNNSATINGVNLDLKQLVFNALHHAAENGYLLWLKTTPEISIDLLSHDSGLENYKESEVSKFINEYYGRDENE